MRTLCFYFIRKVTAANILICFLLSVLEFLYTVNSYSQNQKEIDSLKFIIANRKDDTIKLNTLAALNEAIQDRNEKIKGYKQQIVLSFKLKDYEQACIAYYNLGYFGFESKNYTTAENYYNEAVKIAKQTNNNFMMGRLCNMMMMLNDKKGDMATAMQYLQKGERLLIQVNKKVNLTRLYCNASVVYLNHNMMAQTLSYARKAYATAKSSGELEPVTTASWFLANRLQMIGKYDSAIYFFSQGLHIAQQLGMIYTQGDMLFGLSGVYSDLKNYNTSRDYLKKAIIKYDSVNVPDRKIECEESLAYLNFMSKDFEVVKSYIHLREKSFTEDSINNKQYVYKWLANLALIDNNVEDWQKYYTKYEQADAIKTNDKLQKTMLEMEAKYNLSKKENELLQKDAENRNRLWIISALALAMLSIIIIAVTQYRNYKSRQKIEIQNAIIEKQNALEEERSRIAADMHDDVGAGLSRIRYITSAIKDGKNISTADMDKIMSLSDESVEKMNEIIWSLNQGNRNLAELIYHVRSQCATMVSNANLEFICELPAAIPQINIGWSESRNIFMLVKEAVNNAVKHAAATIISLDFSFQNNFLITVADNGKGYNTASANKDGNGLKNYEKRTASLNGTFSIKAGDNIGTKVMFHFTIANQQTT